MAGIGSRCRSHAYRPEEKLSRVPDVRGARVQKDWVVLDALNHIKDRIDGTLSYRWSCRMGVCGSCGMTVNGEPKLTCATFLTDYAPGPVRVEPLSNFPVIRDLIVDLGDFMRKLKKVKPWLVRKEEKPLERGRVPPDAGRARRVQAVQHVHQLHALLLGLPIYGLDPKFVGPAAIALAQRYNLDSRDQGAARAHGGAVHARGHLGLHVRRRVHEGLPEERRPGRRHPAVQAGRRARLR